MSVIVPVFNEADHIEEVIAGLRRQTVQDFEALFVDGRSTDATVDLLRAAAADDHRIVVVENPARIQSAGLNRALEQANAPHLVRLDGHSFVAEDYVERCLALLRKTGAAAVGGRMVPRASSDRVPAAIGLANRSWWGAGPARFHTGGEAGPAETVYLGSYDRDKVEAVGGWAEDLVVNEDYELNQRLVESGEVIWFDPSIEVLYQPRRTFRALARQYVRYGRSKPTVMRRRPRSTRLRQLIPATLAPGVALTAAVAPWMPLAVAAGQFVTLTGLAAHSNRDDDASALAPVAACAAMVMHWTWSVGFWVGVVRPLQPPRSA